jgi:hypothetical protein
MLGKNIGLLLAGFLILWVILGVERVVGLPALFIFGWLLLASQLRLRIGLIGSLLNGLLVSALYGVGWQWGFLILWLGTWLLTWERLAPIERWWRMLGWSLAGAWLIGGLSQLSSQTPFSWLAWFWPIFWLGLLFILKLRRLI